VYSVIEHSHEQFGARKRYVTLNVKCKAVNHKPGTSNETP